MYRAALKTIISELARQDRLVVVETLDLDSPKTKLLGKPVGWLRRKQRAADL